MNNTDQIDFERFTEEEFNHSYIEISDADAEEEYLWHQWRSKLDNRVDIYSM